MCGVDIYNIFVYSNFTKLPAYGHPFSLFREKKIFFYVVILYKLTANAVLHLKDFLQSFIQIGVQTKIIFV